MSSLLEVAVQSLAAFIVLFFLARLMGKRQMAQLTFFDYIEGITIGNLAASLSLDDVKTSHAIVSLVIWVGLSLILAWIQLKSYRGRLWLDGKPLVLIQDGKVLERNLRKARIPVEEMMLLLRDKDVFELSEVEYAIFENNGSMSVMKKLTRQPLTPQDLGLPTRSQRQSAILIADGHILKHGLQGAGYSKDWLLQELSQQGITNVRDVFLAQVNPNGQLYVDLYQDHRDVEG